MIILERIFPNKAVISIDGAERTIAPTLMDAAVKEGDVLTLRDGIYVRDDAATAARRQKIINLQNSLWDE
ncbi:MAG: DUF3006 domain-containing protein [Oscillospiraceae bacterium]|nr:DUF3006 domain-containing protein [Oscillospiraceae bacterium]